MYSTNPLTTPTLYFWLAAVGVVWIWSSLQVYKRYLRDRSTFALIRPLHDQLCPTKLSSCGRHGLDIFGGRNTTSDCDECRDLGFKQHHNCVGQAIVEKEIRRREWLAAFWLVTFPKIIRIRRGDRHFTKQVETRRRIRTKERSLGIRD